MESTVDTETAKGFHTETPLTANHRHASADRGWPLFFPEHISTRRASSVMFSNNTFRHSHRRSGTSSASDSDDDRLSLYPRRNTLSYYHTQHPPSRRPQPLPLPVRRQSSNSCASSSSSSSTPLHVPSSTSATGRKVAANLQLFKETAPDVSNLSQADRSRSRPPTSKQETPQIASPKEGEEVGETRFVRRTAWPDREAAAIRRGKSTISLKRAKTRDSDALLTSYDGDTNRATVPDGPIRKERAPSVHSDLVHDLVEQRPETLDRGRARERERPLLFPSQLTPSISPIQERRSAFRPRLGSRRSVQPSVAFQEPPPSPAPALALKRTRRRSSATRTSPVLLTNLPLTPLPPVAPLEDASVSPYLESSWSTDDESAWSTTSVASSVATTTSPFVTQDELPDLSITPSGTRMHYSPDASALDEDDEAAYGSFDELDLPATPLPNVPLKPFKNQVGGHSAIYKFTKRAVCKVCTLPIVSRVFPFLKKYLLIPLFSHLPGNPLSILFGFHPFIYDSLWSREKTYSTKL